MGLKERLAKRSRPTTKWMLRIDSDDTARAELAAAQAAGDENRIAQAWTAVEACYEQLVITALPPAQLEELLAAHPPLETDRGKKIFNSATFIPALLAVCIDSDITEEDWVEYTTTGAMTAGEVGEVFNAAWEINYRVPSVDLKKD